MTQSALLAMASVTEWSNEKIDSLMRLAGIFAKSGYFPREDSTPEKMFVKMAIGDSMGISAAVAVREINMSRGKVGLSTNIQLSLVKAHPGYDYKVQPGWDESSCSIDWYQDGEKIGTSSFTIEEAQRAGLLKNQTYRSYAKDMLFNRAGSRGVKKFAPDVTAGVAVYSDEEMTEIAQAKKEGAAWESLGPISAAKTVTPKPTPALPEPVPPTPEPVPPTPEPVPPTPEPVPPTPKPALATEKKKETITREQAATLFKAAKAAGYTKDGYTALVFNYGFSRPSEITAARLDELSKAAADISLALVYNEPEDTTDEEFY